MTKGTLRRPARDTGAAGSDFPGAGVHPGTRAELKKLSDNALLGKIRALPRDSELRAAACEILVDRYQRLVRSCVWQYRYSPEPTEDLMQVGYVGLLKAINNYDPEVGDSLSAYAHHASAARSSGTSATSAGRCTSGGRPRRTSSGCARRPRS